LDLIKNDEILLEKWNSLLSQSSFSSAFQTHAFFDLINSVSGLSANVFAISELAELRALCVVTLQKEKGLEGYFSRRAIIYGGPVILNNYYDACDLLLKCIYDYFKSAAIYIEIRNYF
jgi:serine/alanine adding enzyme